MRPKALLLGFAFLSLNCAAAPAQEGQPVKITPILKTTTTVTGQKLAYPLKNPEVTALIAEIPPGREVGWHKHPNIRYVYVVEGVLTIEMENGMRRDYPAGSVFVEAVETRHHGMNLGSGPLKVLFIDHAEEGQSNMVRMEPPERRPFRE